MLANPRQRFRQAARHAAPSLWPSSGNSSHNKKWWLLPIVIVLFLFGLLIFLSGTGAAPFIYTFH
jgi:hypothetical protein